MTGISRVTAVILLAVSLAAGTGCRTAGTATATPVAQRMVADRLFFGRSIPGGGRVSDDDWESFLRTEITPRFPKGLTVWKAAGQWLDSRGELEREEVMVVEVLHERDTALDASMAAIAGEYRKRFGQDAVMRVESESMVLFY